LNDEETELSEFYRKIEAKRKKLGISRDPAWFRGHSQGRTLCPSLFRIENIRLIDEKNIFTTFLTEGRSHIPNNLDGWSVLAIMQHFKVPTRLLDWSDTLHVALFFALEFTPFVDPEIWILNPYRLNAMYNKTNRVIYGEAEKLDFDYYDQLKTNNWHYDSPIAIAPSWTSPRIAAQRGYFTIHGRLNDPMEKTAKHCVEKVVIPPSLISRLRSELRHSGMDEGRLFPDLEGLAMSIRRRLKQKQ
jgi:hypothetical protein